MSFKMPTEPPPIARPYHPECLLKREVLDQANLQPGEVLMTSRFDRGWAFLTRVTNDTMKCSCGRFLDKGSLAVHIPI
jgi:hypothetical protein